MRVAASAASAREDLEAIAGAVRRLRWSISTCLVTLGLEPSWLEARRWAMLARLAGSARRSPLAAA
jgi:hypothetical protein